MQSQYTRGAHCLPTSASCCAPRFRSRSFGVLLFALLLATCLGVSARAVAQNQTESQASSSSSQTEQQNRASRRTRTVHFHTIDNERILFHAAKAAHYE